MLVYAILESRMKTEKNKLMIEQARPRSRMTSSNYV